MVRDEALIRWRRMKPPLCAVPATFAMSCVFATLATDVAYWRTANVMWADFSDWLVTAGVIVGYVAVVVALIELLTVRRDRGWPTWPAAIAYVIALIVATLDMLVHTRDAWTSVVPWGLAPSAVAVLLLLVAAWMRCQARGRYDVRDAEAVG